MIRLQLTEDARAAVQALRRDRDLAPAERDRVEMVLLSDAGWSPPRIGQHLGSCAATVRTVLKRFEASGPDGLRRGRPGPPKDEARRARVTAALDRLLDQDRTWTAAQLAAALRDEGIALSTRQTRKQVPGGDGRPLAPRPAHRAPQAGPRTGGARRAGAGLAQKKAAAGRIALGFLDESGFSPSQPVNYCWVRRGDRKQVPYESPQGRRYNTMALLVPAGPHAAFDWCGTTRRHFDAADLLHFLGQRPATAVPLVLVLDNASFHRNATVRRARPALRRHNVYLYHLPPYSPELNAIEPVFRAVKHLDLPERRYATAAALEAAVDEAFARVETEVLGQPPNQPRLAA